MADHSSDEAARLAFSDLVEALGRYLHAKGWTRVTVPSPFSDAGDIRSFHPYDRHEFVVPFLATRPPEKGRE